MQRDTTGRFKGKRGSRSSKSGADSGGGWVSPATGIVSLIGGAALGAAAMYLMDPHHGARRRAQAMGAAHRALEATSDAAHSVYHAAADQAAEISSSARAAVPDPRDLGERAHSMFDSARHFLSRRPKLERHSDYAMNPAGVSLTALATLSLGAAAMWIFDPSRGRARRAWLGQKASRLLNEIAGFSRSTGKHLRNKAKGYYHEAASGISHLQEASTPE